MLGGNEKGKKKIAANSLKRNQNNKKRKKKENLFQKQNKHGVTLRELLMRSWGWYHSERYNLTPVSASGPVCVSVWAPNLRGAPLPKHANHLQDPQLAVRHLHLYLHLSLPFTFIAHPCF